MKNEQNFYEVFKEVYSVLSLTDNELVSKIPDRIFQSIVEYASKSDAQPYIDMDKEINEQKISDEAKSILSILWYEYMCDNEEKQDIAKMWFNSGKS